MWEYQARGAVDAAALAALVKAAATQVLPDAQLTAFEQRAVPAEGAKLVTTLSRHPGGATIQVHARIDESFTLVYDAIVSRGGAASALPAAVGAGAKLDLGSVATDSAVAQAPAEPEEDDAAILQDNLTAGAGLAAGFRSGRPSPVRPSASDWAPSSAAPWATSPRTCRGRYR